MDTAAPKPSHPQNVVGHYQVQTLDELQAFLPAVESQCDEELAKDLKATAGPTDAILLWYDPFGMNHNVILDGHRRYAICQKLNLPFKVRYITGIKNLEDAKSRMVRWQLQRRNLTPQQRSVFFASLHKQAVAEVGAAKSAARVAEITGENIQTVKNNVALGRKVESLIPPLRDAITNNTVKASQRAIRTLADMPQSEQQEALEQALSQPLTGELREVLPQYCAQSWRTGSPKIGQKLQSGSTELQAAQLTNGNHFGGTEGISESKRYADPSTCVLEAAKRSLGRLYSDIQRLGKRFPNPVSLRSCENHINGMNSLLKNWEN